MGLLLKIFVLLALAFVFYSIPVNNKTIFDHISKATNPYTEPVYKSMKQSSNAFLDNSKKLFTNADPKNYKRPHLPEIKKIKLPKKEISKINTAHAMDAYSDEEVKALKSYLREI